MAMFEAIDAIFQKIADHNEYAKALVTLTSAVGALVILIYTVKLVYELIQGFRLYVASQLGCCQVNFVERYGQWAVVTGATDGIGQSIAKELACRGMSILVVSRNEEKLARTKAMLEEVPNVGEVETVRIDLSDSSLDNFARIRQQIDPDNRDIGILVNNAGTFPDRFMRYNRFEMDFLLNIANLNMLAPLHMTRMIMPGMIARGKGMVLNVSSILGAVTTPYMSIYGTTKTFMDRFTQQLQVEYSSHPIDIILLTPGPVHTKLFIETAKMPNPTLLNPSADDYARTAVNALQTRIGEYSGTLMHGLIAKSSQFFQMLGLSQVLFRANLSLNVKNYELSPVPKRRRVQLVDKAGVVPAGDKTAELQQATGSSAPKED